MPNNITYDQIDTRVNGKTEEEFNELGKELTEEQLKLRQHVLMILFKEFGKGKYSNQSIYECADEWIEKGHKISAGIVKYYDAYYNK